MDWFRSHHGAPSDTKLAIASEQYNLPRAHVTAVFWELLDYASRSTPRGIVIPDTHYQLIAFQQGIPLAQVGWIIEALQGVGIISNGQLTNWKKRQPEREDVNAALRKRNQRERERAHNSVNVTQNHTASHNVTTDKNRREEIRDNNKIELPSWLPSQDWNDFCDMRRKMRKPMTDKAQAFIMKKLYDLQIEGYDPAQVLQQSTMHAWSGVFPLNKDRKTQHTKTDRLYMAARKAIVSGVSHNSEIEVEGGLIRDSQILTIQG